MKWTAPRAGAVLVAIVFAGLAFRLFRLAAIYAVNIFFWDQWDFNDATLFEHRSVWEIFRFQHGPHRQGLGGAISALVEPWFQWNSRTEAFLVVGLVVVTGVCVLVLKRRLFGTIGWTDVVIPMVIFTPAQWESDWTSANLAHGVLPVLLVVLFCLAWTWRNERWKYWLLTGLNFVTLYTGFGFFLGLMTPMLLTAKWRAAGRGDRQSRHMLLACLLLSLVSLASFFVAYRNENASGCDSLWAAPRLDFVRFFCLMLATPFAIRGAGLAAVVAGAAVVAAVAATAGPAWIGVLKGRAPAAQTVVAVLGGFVLLFCAATTVGRTCTGVAEAHASRYTLYKQLALLSLYFSALAVPRRSWRKTLPWVLLVLLLPTLFVTDYDRKGMSSLSKEKSGWRSCYLAGKSPDECDDAAGPIYPDNDFTHLQEKLDYLRATRQNLFAGAPEVRR